MLDEDKQREIQEELIRKSKIAREEAEQKAKDQAIQRKQNKMQMDNLKNEIESYAAMAEAEKAAPPIGGSGRSLDFFNQHIQRLAEIYEAVGGIVTLGRRNPSRKNPSSIAESDFLKFCLAVNAFLPNEVQRYFNGGASHGLARAIRRGLSEN